MRQAFTVRGEAHSFAPMPIARSQSGMTLLELMAVMGILSILLAIAVPSARAISEPQAVRGQVNAFLSTLRYARSEAVRYRTQIVVCPSNNSESGTPSCSNGANDDWSKGWIVFVNRDGDANYTFNASADTLLRVQGAAAASGGSLKDTGSGPNKFVFRTTGTLKVGGSSSFTFDSTSKDSTRRQRICVSLQGRARVSDSAASCSG